ncbi:hypothetical protein BH10BAC5_BH10BAC5_05420 [soil metagenome]
MKAIKLFVVTLMLCLLSTGLYAQNKISLGVNGGLIVPTGNLGTNFNVSYNAGAEGVLKLDGTNALYADVTYNNLSPKVTVNNNITFSITEISAGYRRVLTSLAGVSARSNLFLDAGAGMYTAKISVVNSSGSTSSSSESKFGINLGIGGQFPLSNSSELIARLKFHNVFTDNENTDYITLGAGVNFDLN